MRVSHRSWLNLFFCCATWICCIGCESQQEFKPNAQSARAPSPAPEAAEPASELSAPADELPTEELTLESEQEESVAAKPSSTPSADLAAESPTPNASSEGASAAGPAAAPLIANVPTGFVGDARSIVD